jgi:hypothetical protein
MIYISCSFFDEKIENQFKKICVLLEHIRINNSNIVFSKTMYNNLKLKIDNILVLNDDIYNKTKKLIITDNRIDEIYNIISDETLRKIVDIIYKDNQSMYDAYDLLVNIRKHFNDENDDNYLCIYCDKNENYDNYDKDKHKIIFYNDEINIENNKYCYYIKYDNSILNILVMTFYKYLYIENKTLEKWVNFLSLYKN